MRFLLTICIAAGTATAPLTGAQGANRNSHYTCSPAWPEGSQLFVDWVTLHVQMPNGSELDMSDLNATDGFRIGEADMEISGADTSVITVHAGGEPDRTCTAR